MKKLGCHIMLHALQHVKLSLPDKLIRKVISYTWLDIFPTSFNNLYCIHKFTDCTVSLSPWPISAWPRMDTRITCYHFQGHHNKCAPAISHSFIANALFPCLVLSSIWVRRMNHQKCYCQMLSMNYVLHCSGLLCSGFSSLLVFLRGIAFWNRWTKVWLSPKGGSPF